MIIIIIIVNFIVIIITVIFIISVFSFTAHLIKCAILSSVCI